MIAGKEFNELPTGPPKRFSTPATRRTFYLDARRRGPQALVSVNRVRGSPAASMDLSSFGCHHDDEPAANE
jgi:hypothetical protein